MGSKFGSGGGYRGLVNRVLFTIVSLLVYRVGSFIPVPYIDISRLSDISDYTSKGIFGMFDLLSGGSLGRMSIFAIGVVPYITASIIIQLLFASVDSLKVLKQDSESGSVRVNQYTRYLCFFIAFFQGYTIATGLGVKELFLGGVLSGSFFQKVSVALTFATGTFFLIWIGERITSRGIGNGVSLIIFVGIVVQFPSVFASIFSLMKSGAMQPSVVMAIVVSVCMSVVLIVLFEKSYRIVKIQHPSSSFNYYQLGGRFNLQSAPMGELPLKLNPSGVIPPIFASSILLLPVTFFSFLSSSSGSSEVWQKVVYHLSHGRLAFVVLYVVLIVFFTFFYSEIVFNPKEISDNFRKSNYFVHKVRPGKNTADFLRSLNSRLCMIGGVYLSVICVIPEMLSSVYSQSYALGGTSMLIIVNVVTDTVAQVHSYIVSFRYGKIMKGHR